MEHAFAAGGGSANVAAVGDVADYDRDSSRRQERRARLRPDERAYGRALLQKKLDEMTPEKSRRARDERRQLIGTWRSR